MVVAVNEVAWLFAADIHRELEPIAVAGQTKIDAVCVLEARPAPALEPELFVEGDTRV